MDEMIELEIEDTTTCYVCGSSILNEGDSLHAWSISYTCGCRILGANGDNSIYLDKYCSEFLLKNRDRKIKKILE